MVYNHHQYLVLELFHHFKKISYPFAINHLCFHHQFRKLLIFILSQSITFSGCLRNGIRQYLHCLPLVKMRGLRYSHVIAFISSLFFFNDRIVSLWMDIARLIYPINGHLDCLHFWAIVNNVSMNIYMFLWG